MSEVKEMFEFPPLTERVEYRHQFSNDELLELGDRLNNQIREKNQLEADKKSAMSAYKSRIDSKDAEIALTGNFLRDKYEIKPVDASKRINPNTLYFELFHPETGDLLEDRKMRSDEIRRYFPQRKNLVKNMIEWYNPYNEEVVVDSRKMTNEEIADATQLKIDTKNEGPW